MSVKNWLVGLPPMATVCGGLGQVKALPIGKCLVVLVALVLVFSPIPAVAEWFQMAKLTASDGGPGDRFGQHCSMYGNWAIVAAPNKASNTGAIYAYERNGGNWDDGTLIASGQAAEDGFGMDNSIWGNQVIVGAFGNDEKATDAGAAYISEWSGSSWSEPKKLTAPDYGAGDRFGSRVSTSGRYAIVGAEAKDSHRGAAYIFHKKDPNDIESWDDDAPQRLEPPDQAAGDNFGSGVMINGHYAIVGAPQLDNSGTGKAYVYQLSDSDSTWSLIATLTDDGLTPGDSFGMHVAITNEYALVGAPYADDYGAYSGEAYLFEAPDNGWECWNDVDDKAIKLPHPGDPPGPSDCFGGSVALSDEYAVVGAALMNSAFVYSLDDLDSNPQKLFVEGSTYFGTDVDIWEDYLIVGDDLTNGWTGAAYVFTIPEPSMLVALLSMAAIGLLMAWRKRRRAA